MTTALVWFRRDLRCHDHAALLDVLGADPASRDWRTALDADPGADQATGRRL